MFDIRHLLSPDPFRAHRVAVCAKFAHTAYSGKDKIRLNQNQADQPALTAFVFILNEHGYFFINVVELFFHPGQ